MRDIYISPIKAVLHCTDDPALDFILCTSEDYLSKPLPSNVLRLDFRDTVDVDDPAAFSAQLAADVASFLQRPDARPELFQGRNGGTLCRDPLRRRRFRLLHLGRPKLYAQPAGLSAYV